MLVTVQVYIPHLFVQVQSDNNTLDEGLHELWAKMFAELRMLTTYLLAGVLCVALYHISHNFNCVTFVEHVVCCDWFTDDEVCDCALQHLLNRHFLVEILLLRK
jgi:hypothetical protein